jgi:hypothetical protein
MITSGIITVSYKELVDFLMSFSYLVKFLGITKEGISSIYFVVLP